MLINVLLLLAIVYILKYIKTTNLSCELVTNKTFWISLRIKKIFTSAARDLCKSPGIIESPLIIRLCFGAKKTVALDTYKTNIYGHNLPGLT